MKKVVGMFVVITILELWALYVFRGHPLVRPEWFGTLLLIIQLMMGLGGVYACRWLLRSSPVARLEGPQRDWTKLWLWCGPLGGILLSIFCVLGKMVAAYTHSTIVGWMVTAHIAGGAVVWVAGLPWAVSDLFDDSTTGFRERLLMQLGIASHVLGFAVYFGFFPGRDMKPVSLLAAVYFFGSILYYLISITVTWNVIFKFWRPRALSATEQAANKELSSPEDYLTVDTSQPEAAELTTEPAEPEAESSD